MIPTLLLIGFVAGLVPRGWLAVPAAFLAWPALLLATGVDSGPAFALAAAALGAANAALGWLLGRGVRSLAVVLRGVRFGARGGT